MSVDSRAKPDVEQKVWSAKTVLSNQEFDPLIRMQTCITFPWFLKLGTDGMKNIFRRSTTFLYLKNVLECVVKNICKIVQNVLNRCHRIYLRVACTC